MNLKENKLIKLCLKLCKVVIIVSNEWIQIWTIIDDSDRNVF